MAALTTDGKPVSVLTRMNHVPRRKAMKSPIRYKAKTGAYSQAAVHHIVETAK